MLRDKMKKMLNEELAPVIKQTMEQRFEEISKSVTASNTARIEASLDSWEKKVRTELHNIIREELDARIEMIVARVVKEQLNI